MSKIIKKIKDKVILRFPQKDSVHSEKHPYRVVYIMDCEACSPLEAALFVEKCIQDLSYRPVFQILSADKEYIEIDLEKQGRSPTR